MTSLVKQIDQRLEAAVGKTPRALGAYVFGGGDANQLRVMADKEALKRVNLCLGGLPQDYAINGEADVTVVIYNVGRRGQQKVTANFAFRKGELTEAKTDAIVKALADVLPK